VRPVATCAESRRNTPADRGEPATWATATSWSTAPLDVVDGGQRVLSMRAIVGRLDRPTAIPSSRVTDAIFRPVWYVPRTIAVRELLPLVQRDPRYLAREGMRVFGDSAHGGREIDPTWIDWSAVTESSFTYQLAQEPGPTNTLGGVKLVFWTPFDVFIHDKPARPLFSERLRAFSHSCASGRRPTSLLTCCRSGRRSRSSRHDGSVAIGGSG